MRRCLVLLVLLCLLPVGMAHGDDHGPFEERLLEGALEPMDLHGTRLAWASLQDGNVRLLVTDLEDGTELTLTSFPAVGAEPVESLAFDGRWVAWTDARFGNLDAFAIDTETGRLLRLSDHSADDHSVDVEDGRFAWVRGTIMLANETGQARPLPQSGAAFEPTFAGGWLAWSQIEGQRRIIRGQYLADGSLHTLADNEGVVHKNLDGADGHIVWMGVVEKQVRLYTRPLHADGTMGELRVLTDWGVYGQPRTGGGHAAWIAPLKAALHVERLEDGRASDVHADGTPLLSDGLLVRTEPDAAGILVEPTRWAEWDARAPVEARDARPYLFAAGVAVLVGGAGVRWWRARRQDGGDGARETTERN